ncbi:MAG: Uma2 family endonuclease [Armatimonadota bacterium]|nr:Uma2 family endonuclease [Armatimonadota bacterium]
MAHPAPSTEKLRMTYEQYLQWKGEDTRAEWVEGEVVLTMPPGNRHQDIGSFLGTLLRFFLDLTGLGEVRPAPFEVYLPKRPASREPDLVVVLQENQPNLSEDRFTGAPDLLVEVVSEDSVRRDRVEKFLDYEREGVREYWLVESRPAHHDVEAFALEGETYVPIEVDGEGWLQSRVLPGFRLKPAWFAGESLPDSLTALNEMLSPELRAQLKRRLGAE